MCGDDDELRREVESLVAQSDESAESEIPLLIEEAARDLVGGTEEEGKTVPKRIGPYRVLELLGRGGMGSVYLAERSGSSFTHKVALKVLLSGLNDTGMEARFKSERQILADLRHPNIARLVDGGTTDDGVPYLAMEYVDGERVDHWCDARRLGVEERIELFRSVCAAVQAAHRSLVVHRDLKPANILVTPDGHPKLLDFGIAKILGPSTHIHTMAVTGTLDRLLTPAFASPEQVTGEPVTTASDVYSLGVVLYELLTGANPHTFRNSTAAEVERAVCRDEPDRPSQAVRKLTGTSAGREIAAHRDTSTDRLVRRLMGDLDTIVMTALRKEPERRYSSVEALSEDLRRYLGRLPVKARPETMVYRAGKFVRRHLGSVVTAAVGVAAVLVFGVQSAINARIAVSERDRAQLAEERARAEAQTSERVSAFLVDLFRVADPSESRGEEITVRQLLDRGATRLDESLEDEPRTRARLLMSVGEVFRNLGEYRRAEEVVAEAVETIRRLDPNSPDFPAALNQLAAIRFDLGGADDSRQLAREALEISRRLFPGDHLETAAALNHLGWLAFEESRLEEGERDLRQALEMRRRLLGNENSEVAETLFHLGNVMLELNRIDEAAELHQQAYAMRRRVLGADHPVTLSSTGIVVATLEAKKEHLRGLELIDDAMPTAIRVVGAEHPDIAYLEVMRGRQYRFLGRAEEAEAAFAEAVRIERLARGPDHPYVGYALIQLGTMRAKNDRLEEAEASFREALRIYRKAYPEGDRNVANILGKLAALELQRGRPEAALELAQQSRELFGRLLPDGHTELLEGDILIGLSLAEAGHPARARPFLEALLPRIEAVGEKDHPYAVRVRQALEGLPPSG